MKWPLSDVGHLLPHVFSRQHGQPAFVHDGRKSMVANAL